MRLIDADKLLKNFEKVKENEMKPPIFVTEDTLNGVISGIEYAEVVVKHSPTIGGWISVKDKTPEDGKEVLVWDDGGFAYIDTWIGYTWKLGGDFGVTHWQYLPEPPEEETK